MKIIKENLSSIITEEDKTYVVLCLELNVVSQGDTEKKAMENLKEAVELYLADADILKVLPKIKRSKLYPFKINAYNL